MAVGRFALLRASPTGDIVAVIVIAPGVMTAEDAAETVTRT